MEEGLAEYLGGDFRKPARGDPRDFYGHQRHLADPSFYSTGGRFVGELVAFAGMSRLLEFYDASEYDDPVDAFEAQLKEHLEVDIEGVVTSMTSAPACSSLAYREKPIVCGRVPLEVSYDADNPTNLVARDRLRALRHARNCWRNAYAPDGLDCIRSANRVVT